MQNQLRAENAADKVRIDKLAAAFKEAERVVSGSARWCVCWEDRRTSKAGFASEMRGMDGPE
jgi:hypothetical protein